MHPCVCIELHASIYSQVKLRKSWIRIWNFNPILHMSKFMWGLHHHYPLKHVSCVYLSFLIFVSSELISAKYYESNINEL